MTTLIGLFVLSAGFVSCSKDDDDSSSNNAVSSNDLIGTWVIVEEIYKTTVNGVIEGQERNTYTVAEQENKITFKANGIFENEDDDIGTWKLNGTTLTVTYSNYDYDETDIMQVLQLTSTTLVVEATIIETIEGVKYEEYLKYTFKKI